ncbi:MarR family winged helix-turn-helix transcriptional regulator [Microbacterium sp.]|uniref:MarR family winged helix-turn-helix transcriptional regulator n=1 Tax=Microbacterium sp. TaxID=51671 RepID=UPI003A8FCC55
MNTDDFTPETPDEGASTPTDRRPLGAWLRLVDALIAREFADALRDEDASRRDWMLLNAISGTVDAPWITARLARGGKRLRRLADLGWIAQDADGAWTLTDDGRAAQARLAEKIDAVRTKVAGAVSPDEFAALTGSLEKIARELGWDESQPMPRRPRGRGAFGRRGFGPGFGPGVGRGFGRGFGSGVDRGFGPGFGPGSGPHFGPGFGPHFGPHGFSHPGYGPAEFEHPGYGPAEFAHAGRGLHREHCDEHGHVERGYGHDRGFGPGRRGFGPGHHDEMRGEFEHRHHGHGHGKGEHGTHGHRKSDARRAERAYERGFAAGFTAAGHPVGSAADGSDAPSPEQSA